jgi:hypothetical protein
MPCREEFCCRGAGPNPGCPSAEALMHLKKKKLYEQQVQQLDGQILNLDQTIFAIEK